MRFVVMCAFVGLVGCSPEARPGAAGEGSGSEEPLGVAMSALVVREHGKLFGVEADLNYLGRAMALDGSTALVADIGGGPLTESGVVHVYDRAAGVWTLTQTLAPGVPSIGLHFGIDVALAGDEAILGVSGDANKGAAYVWRRAAGTWSRGERIVPDDHTIGMSFGASIAMHGDVLVIGAPTDDSAADSAGSAVVFERVGGAWTESAKLVPGDAVPDLGFGAALALEGETIVVGAPATGSQDVPGRAYVFVKTNGTWVEQRLLIENGVAHDAAGMRVRIFGDQVLVGVPGHFMQEPTGLTGRVIAYARQGAAFEPVATLTSPAPSPDDRFGRDIARVGDRLLVGAPGVDGMATTDGGAVYMFERGEAGWEIPSLLTTAELENNHGFGETIAANDKTILVDAGDVFVDVVYAFAVLGSTCAANDDCETGFCVDGVCCESACNGACQTCAAPGQEGLCGAEAASTPEPLCGVYVCGEGSACKSACASTADCAVGHACNAEGVCVPAPKSPDDGPSDDGGADGQGKGEDDDGCTIGVASSSGVVGWIAAITALVWMQRRRARRRASFSRS